MSIKGQVFGGSFNISQSGLKSNFQTGYLMTAPDDYEGALSDFKDAWDKSIIILNKSNFEEFEK